MDRELARDDLDRLIHAAKTYRASFEAVEQAIASEPLDGLPAFVFNLDSMNLEALNSMSPVVAHAEAHRRACRSALHAVAELLALDDPGRSLGNDAVAPPAGAESADIDTWMKSLTARRGEDTYWLRQLDRFIGIVGRADQSGCLYVNGTFEPVVFHDEDYEDITQVDGSRGR